MSAAVCSGPPRMSPTSEPDPERQPASGSPESTGIQAFDHARWIRIVELVQANQPEGLEELYRIFLKGVRFYLCRQLGTQELDDRVHDTFLVVVSAIQRGELREPARLPGFIRTVVRRQVFAEIDKVVQTRRDQVDFDTGAFIADHGRSPEETVIAEQRAEIMRQVLAEISDRDREILTRFYIQEEAQEQICSDMGLSETQFRLLKSRAKARFGELGKRKLVRKAVRRLLFRDSA